MLRDFGFLWFSVATARFRFGFMQVFEFTFVVCISVLIWYSGRLPGLGCLLRSWFDCDFGVAGFG